MDFLGGSLICGGMVSTEGDWENKELHDVVLFRRGIASLVWARDDMAFMFAGLLWRVRYNWGALIIMENIYVDHRE